MCRSLAFLMYWLHKSNFRFIKWNSTNCRARELFFRKITKRLVFHFHCWYIEVSQKRGWNISWKKIVLIESKWFYCYIFRFWDKSCAMFWFVKKKLLMLLLRRASLCSNSFSVDVFSSSFITKTIHHKCLLLYEFLR